jgi:hypothetical protein
MTLAETIYQHSLSLPEQAAREVLDFVQFMEQRYGTVPIVHQTTGGTASNDSTVAKNADDAVSPLYQALERIGFIGCVDTDEQ